MAHIPLTRIHRLAHIALTVSLAVSLLFLVGLIDPSLAYAEPKGSGYGGGLWSSLINVVTGILTSCGALGLTVGLALKAVAGSDEYKHSFSHRLMGSSAMGLMIGLMAVDITTMMLGWVGI